MDGDAYVFSTGSISLNAGTSAVFYLAATGDITYSVEKVCVDLGTSGTSGNVGIELIRNPTAGTIVSNALDCSYSGNPKFTSTATFLGNAYKGANGYTLTDGTDFMYGIKQDGTSCSVDADIFLERGSSFGVNIVAADTMNVSVSVIIGKTQQE